jgi:hypothetical protein
MPRKPTTDVIEHRITLGSWERERADELLNAIEFKQVASPIVDLISDKDAIAVTLVILTALGGILGVGLTLGIGGLLLNKYGEELDDAAKEAFNLAISTFWGTIGNYTTLDEAYVALKIIYDQYEMPTPSISGFISEWTKRQLSGGINPLDNLSVGAASLEDLIRNLLS